jgi:septum formation protein
MGMCGEIIMTRDTLYLGSQSRARQALLEYAGIPFKVLEHGSDESYTHADGTLEHQVTTIAQDKMHSLILPQRADVDHDYLFVLTADTLVKDPQTGAVLGKPTDRAHAVAMLAAECKGPVETVTGCCLKKFFFRDGMWHVDAEVSWAVGAMIEFYVDAPSVDRYFASRPISLHCAGAAAIEEHGLAYLKSINGSYTAVLGLPLYELRQELRGLGFIF